MRKEEVRAFRKHLREFERVLSESYDQTCSGSGVTMAQCHVLIEMEAESPTSVRDLADRLGLDRSTVSRTVDALVGKGLVRREEDPADRRLQRLSLSPEGMEATEGLHRENDAFFGRILGEIPPDRRGDVLRAFELLVKAGRSP